MIGLSELARRYPVGRDGAQDQVHAVILHAANRLDQLLPDGSGKDLAMTNLDQVLFWADASADEGKC